MFKSIEKSGKFKCALCQSTGIQPHSLKSHCLACRGRGEVEFGNSAVICPSCQGKGKSPGVLELACLRCKGVGAVEQKERETTGMLGERLEEIIKRLSWASKEIEKKTKKIEQKVKVFKPLIKEIKKANVWLKNLGSKAIKVLGFDSED